MMTIKSQIKDKYVCFSDDETTDIQGRCVVNIIVGTLFSQQPSEQFLNCSTFHYTGNAEKLCEKIIKALQHNYECDVSKVLLFVSDAASVMLKTGKLLIVIYTISGIKAIL
jgi:hypothetical protein